MLCTAMTQNITIVSNNYTRFGFSWKLSVVMIFKVAITESALIDVIMLSLSLVSTERKYCVNDLVLNLVHLTHQNKIVNIFNTDHLHKRCSLKFLPNVKFQNFTKFTTQLFPWFNIICQF